MNMKNAERRRGNFFGVVFVRTPGLWIETNLSRSNLRRPLKPLTAPGRFIAHKLRRKISEKRAQS